MSRREHNTPPLLPSGYRQLEYIESTGTQWIDTDITLGGHNMDVFWSIDCQYTGMNTGEWQMAIANFTNSPRSYPAIAYMNQTIRYQTGDTMTNVYDGVSLQPTQRHTYGIDFKTGKLYYDHAVISTIPVQPTLNSTNDTTTLFARYDAKVSNPVRFFAYLKLYFVTLTVSYFNHLFVPALRLSDSKPGLYDIANSQFYTNRGTGEFLYN